MAVVKIVPMPGATGPAGPQGPTGPTGPAGLDGATATFENVSAWTPVLSGQGLVQGQNLATGTYLQMGKLAYVTMLIPFSNITDFGIGQYSVTLPFAAARHADVYAGSLHVTNTEDYYSVKGHHEAGEDFMSLWCLSLSAQKDEPLKNSIPVTLQTDDLIHLSFLYEIS